jgi:phospholipid/cholesterol/gamma-HCH transport system permease protein
VNEKVFVTSGLDFSSSPDGSLVVRLMGDWKVGNPLPSAGEVEKKLTAGARVKRVGFDTSELKAWDSGLLTFLIKVKEFCSQNKIQLEAEGLPEGARGLLKLASAVAERKGARKEVKRESFFSMVGASAIGFIARRSKWLAHRRGHDYFHEISGWQATFRRVIFSSCSRNVVPRPFRRLPDQYPAWINPWFCRCHSAQNVWGAIVRSRCGCHWDGARHGCDHDGDHHGWADRGRFCCTTGHNGVNEEIDALKTLGISPMEFLVLPRMIALIIMMPLLCVYSDLLGILGGLIVGVGMLNLGPSST